MINWKEMLQSLSADDLKTLLVEVSSEERRRAEANMINLPPLEANEQLLLCEGSTLAALKIYRLRTNCSLREAKCKIDDWATKPMP